jgi:cyclophilin family peptidyl-prolyl cis-trans isomerase
MSPVYTVDKLYRSMMGPSSTQRIAFPESESDPPELLWVTGYRAVMVDADGEEEMPQEFMCHSNLDFNSARHAELFDLPVYHSGRLFTFSQGHQEIRFPEGFGLPYWSDETFSLTTQVLNLNPDQQTYEVRHRVTLEYVRDRDLTEPMTPVFMTSGWGLVLLEGRDGFYGVEQPAEEHGESCLPGEATGFDTYEDAFGRKFAGHWVVPPGRQVNSTLVTKILNLPYDTTAHYIAVHLHPFAESLELKDLSTGEVVFEGEAENLENRIGLKRVQYFSSTEGIPFYSDHEYQLTSVYNNTTDADQDSMAVLLLYLKDKKFTKRDRDFSRFPRVRHVEKPEVGDERILLRTTHGEIMIGLYDDVAPRHVRQIKQLVRGGLLSSVEIARIEPDFLIQTGIPGGSGRALSAEQQALLRPLVAEFSDIPHRRGVVSMVLADNADPNSAVASFFIMAGRAQHLDGKYTVFGEVVAGYDVVRSMMSVPLHGTQPLVPVAIDDAEVVSR